MKILNNNEIQSVAGGCWGCYVVPGACALGLAAVGVSLASHASGYKLLSYVSAGVAMMDVSAYFIYDHYATTKTDAPAPQTVA